MADAISVLAGGCWSKALPSSIVAILLVPGVALIAAAYTDDEASPGASASVIATMILAQCEGIFPTVSEGWI